MYGNLTHENCVEVTLDEQSFVLVPAWVLRMLESIFGIVATFSFSHQYKYLASVGPSRGVFRNPYVRLMDHVAVVRLVCGGVRYVFGIAAVFGSLAARFALGPAPPSTGRDAHYFAGIKNTCRSSRAPPLDLGSEEFIFGSLRYLMRRAGSVVLLNNRRTPTISADADEVSVWLAGRRGPRGSSAAKPLIDLVALCEWYSPKTGYWIFSLIKR
jgi:hypothetical protein